MDPGPNPLSLRLEYEIFAPGILVRGEKALFDPGRQIDGLEARPIRFTIGPRQKEQRLDNSTESLRLTQDGLEHTLIFLGRAFAAESHFHLANKRRKRRSKLMGRLAGELSLTFKTLADPVEQVVESLSEMREFVSGGWNG
jgi:hypothetical protein